MTRQEQLGYDVLIVGGGPAGLNAALMLGRARRSVLLVDGLQPRNAPAAHMHGFLSRDGTPPGELLATGRREVRGYGGEIITGQARSAARTPDGFTVELDDRVVFGRRLLLATGITDELPDIPGIAERWGRDVLHCPYCHGWEFRDEPIGVLSTGSLAVHQTLMFRQWTDELTLLRHNGPSPTAEELEQLAARDIRVVTGEVVSLEITGDRLAGARLRSGEVIPLRALAVRPDSVPRVGAFAGLGLELDPHPAGGSYLATDKTGRTSVPGVWAAGNLVDPAAQVIGSAASGAIAAGAINADLTSEDTARAVRARRDPFSAESEARNCERVMGVRAHGLTTKEPA